MQQIICKRDVNQKETTTEFYTQDENFLFSYETFIKINT
jgi:hypothetical protein